MNGEAVNKAHLPFATAQKRAALALVACPMCGAPAGVSCRTEQYRLSPNASHDHRVRRLKELYTFKERAPNPHFIVTTDLEAELARV